MEDVVLALDGNVACVSAVGKTGVRGELVGGGVIVEQRVSPAARLRKSLAVFLHEERLREHVRNVDHEGRLGALFRLPLKFRNPGPLRERLSITGNASLVRLD